MEVSSSLEGEPSYTGKQASHICAEWKRKPRKHALGVRAMIRSFVLPRDFTLRFSRWPRLGGSGIWIGFCPRPTLPQGQHCGSEVFLMKLGFLGILLETRGLGVEGAVPVSAALSLSYKGLAPMGLLWTGCNCLGYWTRGEWFWTKGKAYWEEVTCRRSYCLGTCRCPHSKPSLQVK